MLPRGLKEDLQLQLQLSEPSLKPKELSLVTLRLQNNAWSLSVDGARSQERTANRYRYGMYSPGLPVAIAVTSYLVKRLDILATMHHYTIHTPKMLFPQLAWLQDASRTHVLMDRGPPGFSEGFFKCSRGDVAMHKLLGSHIRGLFWSLERLKWPCFNWPHLNLAWDVIFES